MKMPKVVAIIKPIMSIIYKYLLVMKTLILLFNLLLFLCACPALAQTYDTEQISAMLFSNTIERTGKLDYKRTVNLSFKSNGFLTLLSVDEGQQFNQGQLLASLDITELKENKNANYAQLMQAKREVKRINGLVDVKLASERELDIAITQVETVRAAYQIAYYNLEKAQIYAPFTGVVLARNSELGELQLPGQTVLTVAQLEQNWVVKVALSGEEVSQVRLNQSVNVALNRLGLIKGVISKVPAIADKSSHLFIIEVLLPSLSLKSGMIAGQLASVSINFQSDKLVYRVPIDALVSVDEQGKAIVIAKSKLSQAFEQQSFDIFQIDNNFVYLSTAQDEQPLEIITKGWQDYSLGGQ